MAINQSHFRFGYDNGTEVTHTFIANEDVNISYAVDTPFLLRITEQNAAATTASNTAAQFQYNLNGAGWVNITTSSVAVRAVAVAAFTDAANCTKRLSGTGTFETTGAGCTEDGLSGGNANDIAASGNSETEAGLQVVGTAVNNGDTIQFRITTSPTAIGSYLVTPTLTVIKQAAPTVVLNTADAYNFGLDTTPTLNFTGSDGNNDTIEYNIQIDTVGTFNSQAGSPLLSKFSAVPDAGFTAGHPFSGNGSTPIEYTVQSALPAGTYYWRVAAIDPAGTNTYGAWSTPTRTFIIEDPFVISGTSNQTSGTVAVAVNNTLQTGKTGTISAVDGTWSISGVTKPGTGDAVTVFIDSATPTVSTAVTTYSGSGSIGGMVLNSHVLSIGSNQNRSLTLTDLGKWIYSNDNDVMHSVSGSVLTVAADGAITDEKINILAGNTLTIGATETLTTYDLTITGTLVGSGAATINVAHNLANSGTFTAGNSTVTLNGTTQQTLSGTLSGTSSFYNLTITNSSGATATDGERTGFTPGVIFSNTDATTTNNYTITTPNVRVEYSSTHTYTFANINWVGTAGNLICFRNSVADSGAWSLKVTGTQTVSYVNASRSTAIITGGGLAIAAYDGTNNDAGNNVNWQIINTRLRQEINILDRTFSTAGDSGEMIYIDPAKYGGAVPVLTYKFEIVAMVTSGTGTVTLHSADHTPHATISVTATSFTKTTVNLSVTPSAAGAYHINLANGTGLTVQSARVIILQDFLENPINATETQIEIGDYEADRNNGSSASLTHPKYWLYTAANWDGSPVFTAEVSYLSSNAAGAVTITLQKDTAGNFIFADDVTIVSAQVQTVATLSSRVSFTPVNGCNYRIASFVTNGHTHTIFNAKIVVDQTGGAGISGNISTLSTVYSIDTTATSNFLHATVAQTALRGMFAKPDGTRIYFLSNSGTKSIYQADCTTPWDLSTAQQGTVASYAITATSTYAPFFKPDGTKMYLLDDQAANQVVQQYSLSVAWDVSSTVTQDKTKTLLNISTELGMKAMYFSPDGTKLYIAGITLSNIYYFSLSTAWDIESISDTPTTYSPGFTPQSVSFAPNGLKMYAGSASQLHQFTLDTAWDISGVVTDDGFTVNMADSDTNGIVFSPNLSKMYTAGSTGDIWTEYNTGITYVEGDLTRSEPQYLLQNTYINATGLQNYDATWNPLDWNGVINSYYHEIDLGVSSSVAAKLQYDPNGTPADVTDSSATGSAYRSRSALMTMPVAAQTIDTNITVAPVFASRIVVVLQVPSVPTLTTPTATGVVIPDATLGATITSDGGLSITARGTCWGTSPSPTGNSLAEGGTSTGAFSHARTSLPVGVIIYYRGYATNSKGTAYSEDGILIPGPNAAVQYDSDHVTKIATGGSTANTSVYLDFSVTASNSSDVITPKVEVRAIGSSLTGTATHTGEAFDFHPELPDLRLYSSTIYDSANDRIIVYGGKNGDTGVYYQDLWELKIPSADNPNPVWKQLSYTGTPPSARNAMTTVYDSAEQRMIVFGGRNATTDFNDFYYLDLDTLFWSSFTPSGNTMNTRWGAAGVYDTSRTTPAIPRIVIYGGNHITGNIDYLDIWEVSLPADLSGTNSIARPMTPSGTPPSERERSEHTAILDAGSNPKRMIIFGGYPNTATPTNTTIAFTLTGTGDGAWQSLSISGTAPAGRSGHGAIYDPVNQRMVVFMGQLNSTFYNNIRELSIPTDSTSFTWLADRTPADGNLPSKRYGASAMYDDVHDRLLIFGGQDSSAFSSNQVLIVDLVAAASKLYTQEYCPVVNIMANDASISVYDSDNHQMIKFGGYGRIYNLNDPEGSGYHINEIWAYGLDSSKADYNSFNFISPQIGPMGRELSSVVYDSYNKRIIIWGGLGYNQDEQFNDTWAMSNDPANANYRKWIRLSPTGTPPSKRWGSATIYDPVNQRMIIYGGRLLGEGSAHYNDVHTLSLTAGSEQWRTTGGAGLTINGTGPTQGIFQATAVYDPTYTRMLFLSGQLGAGSFTNKLWELRWDNGTPNTLTWTDRTPTYSPAFAGRRGHVAVYQGEYTEKRMVVFGGWDGSAHYNDIWKLDISNLAVTATKITPSAGDAPIVRRSHNAIYDPNPTTKRMIIQGGRGELSPVNFLKDFWELTLPSGDSNWTWTQLDPITYLKTSVSVPTLTNNTGYHWQAWATGSVSGDTIKVSYGGNAESVSDFIIGTLSSNTGIKMWNGTDWVYKPVKVRVGSNWVEKPIKVWVSGEWVVKG